MEMALKDRIKRFVDERGFAGTAHARDANEGSERDAQGNFFQVVPRAAFQFEPVAVAFSADFGDLELETAERVVVIGGGFIGLEFAAEIVRL